MSGNKRIRKQMLSIAGKTEDNRLVLNGLFKFVDAQGVPLDIVLEFCVSRGFQINWVEFLTETVKRGWNWESTLSKVERALLDVHTDAYAAEVMKRIRLLEGLK